MKVWDGFIRFFHWALVACIVGLYISGEEGYLDLHFVLGYVTLSLLATRLIWGLFGSQSARLSKLFHSPKAVLTYFKTPGQYVGHNPAGSIMVLLFFALLLLQGVAGLMTTDDILYDGPLVQYVGYDVVDFMSSIHHQNFNFIIAAIVLHILAVVVYSFKGEKLVPAMVHGNKPSVTLDQGVKSSVPAFIIFFVIAGVLLTTVGLENMKSIL